MLVLVLFELTIVVDSVSFSWDLGPCTFVNFYKDSVTVCL